MPFAPYSFWIVTLTFCRMLHAGPSESTLATRVETQAEVAVGHTNYSATPLSRFSILVSEIAQGQRNPASLMEGAGESSPLEFNGDFPAALAVTKFLTESATSTLLPLAAMDASPNISELAGGAAESVRLLSLALEKGGPVGNPLMTLSAKGAVQSWNKLVNALMDRMEQLYKDPVPDAKEWESIRNFLMDPKTHEFRGVLAGFAEKKSTP